MAFHPYPTDTGLGEAVQLVIDAVRDKAVDFKEASHACWHLAGYGLSQWDQHGPQPSFGPPPTSDDEICNTLETLKPSAAGAKKAIPWAILLPLLMSLLERFLKKQQPA